MSFTQDDISYIKVCYLPSVCFKQSISSRDEPHTCACVLLSRSFDSVWAQVMSLYVVKLSQIENKNLCYVILETYAVFVMKGLEIMLTVKHENLIWNEPGQQKIPLKTEICDIWSNGMKNNSNTEFDGTNKRLQSNSTCFHGNLSI